MNQSTIDQDLASALTGFVAPTVEFKTTPYSESWYRENFPTKRMVTVTNPTAQCVRFDVFIRHAEKTGRVTFVDDVAQHTMTEPVTMRVTIEAGKSIGFPIEHVRAIKVIQDGIVIGGAAPQLAIEGEPRATLHHALAGDPLPVKNAATLPKKEVLNGRR